MILLKTLLSVVLQVLLSLAVPFICFLFRKQKQQTFRQYIGLYAAPAKAVKYVLSAALLFVAAGIGMAIASDDVREAVLAPASVTGSLRAMGVSTVSVTVLLLTAIIKTAFAEEVFFRGFIAKHLVRIAGFKAGNLLQAIIFGTVHVLLFKVLTQAGIPFLLFVFLFSAAAAWVIGYIKERYAEGSIVPGWMAHALGNVISYVVLAYML